MSSGTLTQEQLDFIEVNQRFWNECLGAKHNSQGYVLVPIARNPITYYCDAALACIVAKAKNLRPLFVINSKRSHLLIAVLKSFSNAEIVNISDWWTSSVDRMVQKQALEAYATIHTPEDLICYRLDDLPFGDVIYDAVLAKGYATVNRVDKRTLRAFKNFFLFRTFIQELIANYNIKCAVFSHTIGIYRSTFRRYLLKDNIEVMTRIGSHQIVLQKSQTIEDIDLYPTRVEYKYFRMMMDDGGERFLKKADDYLQRRFNQEIKHPAADAAFDKTKRIFKNRASFSSSLGLDPAKPNVFVMLHAFTDYPNSHFTSPRIFRDYYEWMIHTLKMAKDIPSVNWIFKEHPVSTFYPTKDLDLERLFQKEGNSHVRFLGHQANFNSESLRYIAHAIITCMGSAGLEHATCGIPCILGGQSGYEGYGFTIEPQNLRQYDAILRGIDQVSRLNETQVKAAKCVAYFYLGMLESTVFEFCPPFDNREIFEWKPESENRFWRQTANFYRDSDQIKKMNLQIEELSKFILDTSWTQYVDLEQFPDFSEKSSEKGVTSTV